MEMAALSDRMLFPKPPVPASTQQYSQLSPSTFLALKPAAPSEAAATSPTEPLPTAPSEPAVLAPGERRRSTPLRARDADAQRARKRAPAAFLKACGRPQNKSSTRSEDRAHLRDQH